LAAPALTFLAKEAVRLATEGATVGVACEGCPVCFNAKKLSPESLIGGAELQGTVPMWAWIGDEAATTFSY
jgi:hypothetical protein